MMIRLAALPFDLSNPDHRAEYFRVIMNRKQLSLNELADGIQMSKSLVSAVLNGHKQSRRVVRVLAEYLGLDPDMFYPEEEADTPRKR